MESPRPPQGGSVTEIILALGFGAGLALVLAVLALIADYLGEKVGDAE